MNLQGRQHGFEIGGAKNYCLTSSPTIVGRRRKFKKKRLKLALNHKISDKLKNYGFMEKIDLGKKVHPLAPLCRRP